MSQTEEPRRRGLFRRRPKDPSKPGRIGQMRQVFKLARKHFPAVPWLMLAAILGLGGIGFLVGFFLLPPVWLWTIIGLLGGLTLAIFILGRYAETAAFAEMKDQPGAYGAVLNTVRRSWLADDQPVAGDPRTKDLVFRATGRGGVVLVSEGPAGRVSKLLAKEQKRHERILPSVPVHVIQGGEGKNQVPMNRLVSTVYKLPKKLTKAEVLQVRKRLAALGTMSTNQPIPKGIDPNRARPNRRALRGR
ncbi:DUF4191 domain-containing protein [Brevibacterium ravenspurgense]|uniref:DUF4191 domain-containing protein n=1 Tax=Brevibacterium ravenspurgense TaxID=479117 RepID=A0A150H8S7_9MICO|nr:MULTISPECIES: DUF4191 domain-containing protein [Brevibacterium]KXZ58258.1 hypothetical protein Bravens_01296 [Brevibacterium ravenspurgense]OFT94615.1 hypothetical protein HMPREF3092_01860 [Brevibacterium sp. HMSC24B04]PKY71321.1 DUF4191 domain-containing protein [Brevibacterium ravenspurgense]